MRSMSFYRVRIIHPIILVIMLFLDVCIGKRYDKYPLLRALPINIDHIEFFKNASEVYDINFWKDPGLVNMPVVFTINPLDSTAFLQNADKRGIYLTTIMEDIQSAFDNQTVKTYIRRNMDSFDWRNFFHVSDMYDWLKDLQRRNPDEIKLFSIGESVENRPIIGVKIALNGCKMRSKVIIEGGIHAREWISPAFVTYFINEIVKSPQTKNEEFKRIALTYEWYFIPVLNPDGYEYTMTEDRLWRKNRRNYYGIDLNRNFGAAFGTVGVARNKTSDQTYCGPHAFSEPESEAMAQFIGGFGKSIEYFISFHSFGQLFIIPYAYSTKHAENFDEMKLIGHATARRIRKHHGRKYKVGTAFDTVGYMAAGASTCWVKRAYGVPYVATIELPDVGNYGFALPPEQILPTCKETMDGMVELFKPRTPKFKLRGADDPDAGGKSVLDVFVVVFCAVLSFSILF